MPIAVRKVAAHEGLEKRRFVRHKMMIPVELEIKGEVSSAQATTLAVGGAYVLSPRWLEPDSRVDLTLSLDDTTVSVKCRVVYNRADGMGLEFMHVKTGGLARLIGYFRANELPIFSGNSLQ